MSKAPVGWGKVAIKIVTENCSTRIPDEEEEILYIDISSIDRVLKKISTPQRILGREAPSRARREVLSGDVLVSMTRPNLNAVAIVPQGLNKQIASTGFDVLRAPELDSRWLFYSVQTDSFIKSMSEVAQGALYPAIKQVDIRNYEILLPPLQEQNRIADKLDAMLEKLNISRERIDNIPLLLKDFRQSVFSAAASGKLTEEWRAAHSLHDEWENVTIGSLLKEKPRNGYSPPVVKFETPVKTLSLTATTTGKFRPDYFKYVDEEIPESSHLWLHTGDILIQRANSIEHVGISAIYDGLPNRYIYPDLMMKCRANDQVITKFLHYLLLREETREYFRENATGTSGNMPKINQQTILHAPAMLPTISEQKEIVRRGEELLAFADRIERHYDVLKDKIQQSVSSLLAKAMQGTLVEQDVKDEPVSILLDRIRKRHSLQNESKNPSVPKIRKFQQSPNLKTTMVKSRYDHDVKNRPYLATIILREMAKGFSAEDLFKNSELSITDFYKQLAWELDNDYLREDGTLLIAK